MQKLTKGKVVSFLKPEWVVHLSHGPDELRVMPWLGRHGMRFHYGIRRISMDELRRHGFVVFLSGLERL